AASPSPQLPKRRSSGLLTRFLRRLTSRFHLDLLIILDQFEEYFLYPQREGNCTFATEVPRAIRDAGLCVNFLVSLREDWVAKLDRFKEDIPGLFDNYLRIKPLNHQAAHMAIVEPVHRYNELVKNGNGCVAIKEAFKGQFAEEVLSALEH